MYSGTTRVTHAMTTQYVSDHFYRWNRLPLHLLQACGCSHRMGRRGVMTNVITSFADLLRQLRIAGALSQEELANRAGLSLRGISDLERGVRRTPHLTTVSLLAGALALTAEDRQALLAAARMEDPIHARSGLRCELMSPPMPLTSLLGREQELPSSCGPMCGS
jgi:transcriptional regulator with XRE-family HTH domain